MKLPAGKEERFVRHRCGTLYSHMWRHLRVMIYAEMASPCFGGKGISGCISGHLPEVHKEA